MQKDEIIAEMRRTAQENDGKPLGSRRFEQVTGIKPYDWGKYWARFGDAQRDAGFEPNKLNSSFSDEYLLERVANLTRDLQRFPTTAEQRLKRESDPGFPDEKTFRRFGSRSQLLYRLLQHCQKHPDFADIAALLEPIADTKAGRPDTKTPSNSETEQSKYGFVYLVRGHPGEYKIGRTTLVDRRLSELGATSAIEHKLIHEIKTDDPSGIESYWHRRFEEKRMKGEWFKLTPVDLKAFKRWKRIY